MREHITYLIVFARKKLRRVNSLRLWSSIDISVQLRRVYFFGSLNTERPRAVIRDFEVTVISCIYGLIAFFIRLLARQRA
jgi:hypothetical protein